MRGRWRRACGTTRRVPTRRRAGTIRGAVLGAGAALALLLPVTVALAGPSPQRTVRVRLVTAGNPNGPSTEPALSGDARKLAFTSAATNLTAQDDFNSARDVFVFD